MLCWGCRVSLATGGELRGGFWGPDWEPPGDLEMEPEENRDLSRVQGPRAPLQASLFSRGTADLCSPDMSCNAEGSPVPLEAGSLLLVLDLLNALTAALCREL